MRHDPPIDLRAVATMDLRADISGMPAIAAAAAQPTDTPESPMSATVLPTSLTATRTGLDETSQEILAAGLCLTGNLGDPEDHFEDAVLELAHRRYKGLGVQETILRAAQANGYPYSSIRADYGGALRAAFSTTQLGGILSNVANKFLLEGFNRVEQSWREIARIKPVKDFKPVESYRLIANARFEKVAPGGELKHGTMSEERFGNQADTYGHMLSIPRQDILNDDLGALTVAPGVLGRGAGMSLVENFWSEFTDNAGFFTSGNQCLVSGADTALTIDGLTKAEIAFNRKTESDGKPLGIAPAILLVPTTLGVAASQLMSSLEIRDNLGGPYPTANPHVGKFRIVKSVWLNATSNANADSHAWYLLADPRDMATVEVVFLNGQETPIIEEAKMDFAILGVQMRGYYDYGVRKQDPRGGTKMAGR